MRATQDVDFLVEAEAADKVHVALLNLGYECLYRSEDAANYVQGYVNDATRTRDLDDIRALLKIHRASLDLDELREYFALFNRPELLHELLGYPARQC